MSTKKTESRQLTIGVISDSHGHLPLSLVSAFEDVDHVLHAGDIDAPHVLESLRRLAPVTAVRGNMDRGEWAQRLSQTEVVTFGATDIYMLHDPGQLDLDPAAAGFQMVISGHTHRPLLEERNGVLYLNPGSCTAPRQSKAATVAKIILKNGQLRAEHLTVSA